MEEHNIRFIERTFGELKNDIILPIKDPYGYMSSLSSKMREALLNNPSGYKDDEVCQILALDGDTVVGVINAFSGRVLIDGKIVPTQHASYLISHENYRKDNVGGELLMMVTNLNPSKNCFVGGMSQMAIGLYKVLKYSVFEFPRLIYLRHSKSVIQYVFKSESVFTKPLVFLVDLGLLLHRSLVRLHNVIKYRKYEIEEVEECPFDVERIVKDDTHPFMEYHDKGWFDWSLKYSISEDARTKRRLYVVKHDGNIEAFFLIKQEFFETASSRGIKNVYLGSVMEWGILKTSKLNEKDIIMMSMFSFDRNVDGIQYATTDLRLASYLKWWVFIKIGMANIGARIKSIKDERLKSIDNWRIRLAANDTVLN